MATSKTVEKVASIATRRGGQVSDATLKFMWERVGIQKVEKGVEWVKRKADGLLNAVLKKEEKQQVSGKSTKSILIT